MFQFVLLEPDHEKATAYFTEYLKGWAYFANRIGKSDLLKEGKFYVIGNTDSDPEKVDNLASGWQIFPPSWYDERHTSGYTRGVLYRACIDYLAAQPGRVILFEDFMANSTDGWIQNEPEREFYTIGNTLLYAAVATTSDETIRSHVCDVFKLISIGLFIRNVNMQGLQFRQEIAEGTIEEIWLNIEAIVSDVYDGDSYAFSIRNGNDTIIPVVQDILLLATDHFNKSA